MLPEHRALLEDEPCPVTDQMLGELYRASAHGLNELIATVSPTARALLAVYCYRRAHLASIGLAIAATCEKDDLTSLGGNVGTILFEQKPLIAKADGRSPALIKRRPSAIWPYREGSRRALPLAFCPAHKDDFIVRLHDVVAIMLCFRDDDGVCQIEARFFDPGCGIRDSSFRREMRLGIPVE
jgi:hypothetical protein